MSYDQAVHFAHTWGLVLAVFIFGIAGLYALWPGNKTTFDHAARAPLLKDDADGH